MYSASNPGSNSIIWPNATGRVRAFVEDLFHQYDVDLYLCGHVHAVSAISAHVCGVAVRYHIMSCLHPHLCLCVVQYERHYPIYRGAYTMVRHAAC